MPTTGAWLLQRFGFYRLHLLSHSFSSYTGIFQSRLTKADVALEEGVQECIESLQDLKANNAEENYLKELGKKIDAVEKRHIIAELGVAVFVVSSTLILKFGIATVALVGSALLIRGEIDIPLFFMFLLVASRLYAPLEGALQNLAAVISTKTNINRMNEILDQPIQTGTDRVTNKGYDIVFDHVGFAYNTGETVLKDVSFTAKQGEVTALVGPSGGGKTTVSTSCGTVLGYKQRQDHSRRHGYIEDRAGNIIVAVFYCIPGCNLV